MSNQIQIHNENGYNWTEVTATKQPDPFIGLPSPNVGYIFPTSNYIKLQARKVSFQIATLGQTTHTYTSPDYADMIALSNYFADWSCNYEIQEGPVHTFTVTCPWDTMTSQDFNVSIYASEQWELVPTMDTKPLLANGLLVNPFVPASTTGNYVILPDALQIGIQNALDRKTGLNLSGSVYASKTNITYVANQTLNYMRRGIEGVPSYTQTLKRTAVIDKNNRNNAFNTIADSTRNSLNQQGTVNFILSTPGMISGYAVPNNTVAKFMNRSYCKQISVSGLDNFIYKVYAGWLVKPPTFQFITRNKVQMSQEFQWNEWASGLYYIHSPASDFGNPIIVPTNT